MSTAEGPYGGAPSAPFPRRRWVALAALGAALLLVGVLLVAQRVLAPTPLADDIELGGSRRHSPSALDLLALVARAAVSASAAGASIHVDAELLEPLVIELNFLDQVNVDRAKHGLDPVEFDPLLTTIARLRAESQFGGPLSHFDTFGQLAFVGLLSEAEVGYQLAGENLARSSRNDPSVVPRLQQALMNSLGHRANILEPSFNRLGIGAATGPAGEIAFAQVFLFDAG